MPNVKNEPLPDFEDKYWLKDADNQVHETKQISCTKHKFNATEKAQEVECDCGVGYQLSPGMELKTDGHIYCDNSLVI